MAATSQRAFENVFFECAESFLRQFPDLPVHCTGGCGLNILLNTRLVEEFGRTVFVEPNPSDCGLAVGMLANTLRPDDSFDVTYAGIEPLDKRQLLYYVHQHRAEPCALDELVDDLTRGMIVGLMHGRSEHGPRALGNRSILCAPTAGMQETLNRKVKGREYYRPFAPVVRLEDLERYFEWKSESRWMTFSPRVRSAYQQCLASVTHVDGTARVQTVTEVQNELLYQILSEYALKAGTGVLLNTSLNTAGRPIVASYREGLDIFLSTELDRLYLDGYYFKK